MNEQEHKNVLTDLLTQIRALKDGYTIKLTDPHSYSSTYMITLRNRVKELQADELRYMEWLYE